MDGLGGIVTSLVYRQQDAPGYRPGVAVSIALQGLIILLVGMNTLWFTYRNRQVRRGGKPIEGLAGFLYII
jgi:hypothetical protein